MKIHIDSGRVLWILLVFLQTLACIYVINASFSVYWIEHIAFVVTLFYKWIGFDWHYQVALVLSYCFAISLAMNIVIYILNMILPRRFPFKLESKDIRIPKYWLFFCSYALAIVFFVGVWGANMSDLPEGSSDLDIRISDIIIISVITFLMSEIMIDVTSLVVLASIVKLKNRNFSKLP